MKRAISEMVGRAELAGHASVAIYRALAPLRCASCDSLIAEGELFTRRNTFGHGLRIQPRCRKCAPFTLMPEEAKTVHSMLDSLLSPAAETSTVSKGRLAKKSSTTAAPEPDEKQKRIKEAMIERLGPALRRTRHRRT
jgi:hypothetical protein